MIQQEKRWVGKMAADYDIGDIVPFELTGTLPSNYADYKTYNTFSMIHYQKD